MFNVQPDALSVLKPPSAPNAKQIIIYLIANAYNSVQTHIIKTLPITYVPPANKIATNAPQIYIAPSVRLATGSIL